MQGSDTSVEGFPATKPEPTLTRRRLLVSAGVAATVFVTPRFGSRTARAGLRHGAELFQLGVASGDPLPDSVVLWTRLARNPLLGGDLPNDPIPVRWELARDEGFRSIVRSGEALARSELAHSVHVIPEGLEPARWYWYRFRAEGHESPVGRTRTAPGYGTSPARLRFAFASCQDWQAGYWPAFSRMAEEDLDLVVHLGDYIYEYGINHFGVRQHEAGEVGSLENYRNRHALYKTDPALQAAHAAFPWIVTWDDHEVENNYAGAIEEVDITEPAEPPAAFLARRANAYRAYYEHLPLRPSSLPMGPNAAIYRRQPWGNLADFSVLDTRQYRTDQPCGDGLKARCAEALDPNATMTGPEQERWLLEGLRISQARWNVIAQQTILFEADFLAGPGQVFNMDQWDGYVAARNRLLSFLLNFRPSNPIVLTGDIHSSWVGDLKADFANPGSATVGTEFVGTSISSDFPTQFLAPVRAALADNPHIKFFDGIFRGYVRCELDASRWRSDFRVVPTVAVPDAPISTLASFVVENGVPGAQRV